MSRLAGVVRLDGSAAVPADVEPLVAPLRHGRPGDLALRAGGAAVLAQFADAADLLPATPVVLASGAILAADVRLDNNDELAGALGLPTGAADIEVVAAAWAKWGAAAVARLSGDFGLAVWEPGPRRLWLARDHFGVRPLYYARGRDRLAFSTELGALLGLPWVDRRPNERLIGDYLLTVLELPQDPVATFYTGVFRLPPAHRLILTGVDLRHERFWRLDAASEMPLGSDEAYVEAFREKLDRAVGRRLRCQGRAGSCLSGGVDSSTLSVTARYLRAGAEPWPVFFGKSRLPENDESQWVQAVVGQGGYALREVPLSSPLALYPEVLTAVGEPYCYDNLADNLTLLRAAAAAGVGVVLDGYAGDLVVSTTLDYMLEPAQAGDWAALAGAAQAAAAQGNGDPEYYFWEYGAPVLRRCATGGRWLAFRRHAAAAARAFGLRERDLWWRLWVRPLTPPPLRKLYRRWRGEETVLWRELNPLLAPAFVRELDLAARARAIKADWTQPVTDARVAYRRGLERATVTRGLEWLAGLGAAAGVQVRCPFLDRELVEFCCGLPRRLHGRDGWDRWIVRRAMDGRLPPAVQWRRGKTDYGPSVVAGRHQDLPLMAEVIDAAPRRLRRYVDGAALRDEWERFKRLPDGSETAAMAGHRLWRVVLLDRWLSRLESA